MRVQLAANAAFLNLPLNDAWSQRVAARLVVACLGSVPTHGRSIRETGGRSSSVSMAGALPTGSGATCRALGRAGALAALGQRAQRGHGGGQEVGVALDVGPGGVADHGGGGGREPPRARDADRDGGQRVVVRAEHDQHRLVAEALHATGRDQLRPLDGAAGEPAQGGGEGPARGRGRVGQLGGLDGRPGGSSCRPRTRRCAPARRCRRGRRSAPAGRGCPGRCRRSCCRWSRSSARPPIAASTADSPTITCGRERGRLAVAGWAVVGRRGAAGRGRGWGARRRRR